MLTRPERFVRPAGAILSLLVAIGAESISLARAETQVLSVPASNDGITLNYGLSMPEGTRGKLPLIVDVTPTPAVQLDISKLAWHDLSSTDSMILRLPAFGRGGTQWSPFAQRDNLQIIKHIINTQSVDPDRVYLLGATQGYLGNGYGQTKLQHGTLNLAYHNSDLFAGVVAAHGDVAPDAYRGCWLGDQHQYQLQFEYPIRMRETPVLWAENLVNTPLWLTNPGGHQIDMYHILDRFDPVKLKLINTFEVNLTNGPGVLPDKIMKEQINWLLTCKLERLPKRVVLTTNTLKHNTSRWVRVDTLTAANRFCRIESWVTADGRIKVRGAGFEGFTISSLDKLITGKQSVTVDIEHQLLDVPVGAEVSFRRAQDTWEIGTKPLPAPAKTATMTDSLIDTLSEPYVLVVGTGEGAQAKLRTLADETIKTIQNSGLQTAIDVSPVPLKTDTAVTPEDMKHRHLVLFGDERTNSIIRKINGKLPIRLDAGKIISGERTFTYPDQALILVYPNPLEPRRKVIVITGALHKAYKVTEHKDNHNLHKAAFPANLPAHGLPLLGDWLVFRQNGKGLGKQGRGTEGLDNSVVEGGYFDAAWQRGTGQPGTDPYYFFNRFYAK